MKLEIFIKEIEGDSYLCLKLSDLTLLKTKRKTFTPPTVEQVREYCKERRNQIDPVLFIAYYKTRGWMLSKTVKMKDWKSAIITWEKNRTDDTPKGTNLNAGQSRAFIPPPISKSAITHEQYQANKNK